MKVLGLFSGGGMLEKGFEIAGYDIVASNEIDPTICKTLRANFKHDVIDKSIHQVSVEDIRKDYGSIDGIVGGYPCPAYSSASDIHGTRLVGNLHSKTAEKYPRYARYAALGGELFLHYFRMVANLQPQFFVIENVPGMLAARIVRETFRNTPCNKNDLGYYYVLHEGILDAVEFGLPQRRPRYFFVGSRKNYPLNIRRPAQRRKLIVGDILEPNVDVELPEYIKARLNGEYRDKPIITEAGEDSVAPTCIAHYSRDRGTRLVKIGDKIRPYTPREYSRLQGIPDDFELQGSESYKYLQAGNSVALPVAYAVACGIKEMLN